MGYNATDIPGFWDRVNVAIGKTDMSVRNIAREMGVCDTYFQYMHKHKGMGSGVLKRFCMVTGVSADWLLGLKEERYEDIH